MIITAFAKYLQNTKEDKSALDLLIKWIKETKENPATNNIERVIHHEIFFVKNISW